MIQYIKIFIISLITGIFGPLAASSSAHYTFLNSILNFTENGNEAAFYFSIISIVFSVVAIFFVRKIYAKGFSAVFASKKKKMKNADAYRSMMTGILISLIPVIVMFIPVSKEKFLVDVFSSYLTGSSAIVGAFCCFASGFILIIALWYARNKKSATHRSSTKGDVLRVTLYQIPSFVFPGFSNIASAATCLELSGIDNRFIMREIFIFISPSTLAVGILRLVRCLLLGVAVDIYCVLICILAALVGSILIFLVVSKINIRKSFLFFSLYSILFGLCLGIVSFL